MNVVPRERVEVREPRVRLIPFEQITLSTARRHLVRGLIPRVGLTLVWGPPKSGKSFWTFDVAMHVALGWEYRGRRVQQGPVVYAAFEGQSGIEARVEAFRVRFLGDEVGEVPFHLQPVTLDLVRDVAELVAAVRVHLAGDPPALVVLDTLNRSLAGSESSDEDMAAYVRAADSIRDAFNCAVVVVHHCGIDGSRPRGHTSLTGAVDAQLSVKRSADDTVIVEVELAKDGPQGDVIASRLELVEVGTDEDDEPITSCVVVPSDGTSPRASRVQPRTTKAGKIALRALHLAIDEAGELPPASNHIPADTRAVTVDQWRTYAYKQGISQGDTPDAKRKAFNRTREALVGDGHVVTWDPWVWPAGRTAA